MAVVWQQTAGDNHYEVRHAGGSIRLYRNGVFHSQWNSARPLSGGVWDLLFLPALFLPAGSIKRVLVLGVGGGAVLRQYLNLLPVDQLVGVELDPVHLQVAEEHFGLKHPSVELIQADAIQWVKKYRGRGFDIVVEDLFTEQDGEALRVVPATEEWFGHLRRLLRPGGALVINFEDVAQLRDSNRAYRTEIGDESDCCFGFSLPTYGNCIGAFLSAGAQAGTPLTTLPKLLRGRLNTLLQDYPGSRRLAQRFSVKRIHTK